jgi:hypothetical protein
MAMQPRPKMHHEEGHLGLLEARAEEVHCDRQAECIECRKQRSTPVPRGSISVLNRRRIGGMAQVATRPIELQQMLHPRAKRRKRLVAARQVEG